MRDDADLPSKEICPNFKKENDHNSIEYKYLLLIEKKSQYDSKKTQMLSRVCSYGQKGMCYYLIGVHDDGEAIGISSGDMIKTLWVLYQMAYEN